MKISIKHLIFFICFRLSIGIVLVFFVNTILFAQWSYVEMAPMPERVSNNAVTAVDVDGKKYVYSFSGIDSTKRYSGIHKRCFKYDVELNQWSRLPDLPSGNGRIAAGASVINGKVYIVGGYEVFSNGGEISVSKVHVFDPIADTFMVDASDIPLAIDDHVQDVWRDSLLYVVTGWSNSTNVSNVQVYNPDSDTWLQGNRVPNSNNYKVFGGSGTVIGDTIYYSGGASIGGNFPASRFFRKGYIDPQNPLQITWTGEMTDDARGYRMAAASFHGNPIWFGGSEVTYNYNGIAYNGSGGVVPLGRIIEFSVVADSFIISNDIFPPQMDFRGIGKIDENTFILAGGMTENQSVTNRTLLLKFNDNSATSSFERDKSVSIKPNPFVQSFEIISDEKISKIQVYNNLGQKVGVLSSEAIIDNWTFGNGIFYLDIEFSDGMRLLKKVININ